MAYSVGVEYSLHCLVYLIDVPANATIGIKELADFQGISETYLSKAFGKLAKAGIVISIPGVKGGYRLARAPHEISFWDVVEAVEGAKPVFQCKNLVDKSLMERDTADPACCNEPNGHCLINIVMLDAEEKMRAELRSKTLAWLNQELDRNLPREKREATRAYFNNRGL